MSGFVGLAVAGATGEPLSGIASAALVIGWGLVRRWMDRMGWSFGDGFLGYRPDQGRPRGVQEDDDFHWNWR